MGPLTRSHVNALRHHIAAGYVTQNPQLRGPPKSPKRVPAGRNLWRLGQISWLPTPRQDLVRRKARPGFGNACRAPYLSYRLFRPRSLSQYNYIALLLYVYYFACHRGIQYKRYALCHRMPSCTVNIELHISHSPVL